jgi:hypothetical protein
METIFLENFHIQTIIEQYYPWKLLICFKDMIFILDDKKMFGGTLCYDNTKDCYFKIVNPLNI